jgi:hypothetical protein
MATAHQQVQNKYRARTPSLLRASSGGADLLPYWGGMLAMFGGFFSDYLLTRRLVTVFVTSERRLSTRIRV